MLLKTHLIKKGYYCTAMKKLLLHFLLLGSYFLTSAQSQNLEGNYDSYGFFFHPTASRAFTPRKTLIKISTNTYQVYLGDLGGNNYSFQFTIDPNNNLVNWLPVGSTPQLPSSNFMNYDNPGGFTYSGQLPGVAPYVHASYNNTYDSLTHTFWLHYGYGVGSANEAGFSRQIYEKLILVPPPILTSFSPTSGTLGTEITIIGRNLSTMNNINFQNRAADSFYVVSDSVVKAIVGNGQTGKIFVAASNGLDSIGTFTFIPPVVDTNQWQYVGNPAFSSGPVYSTNMAISKTNIPYVVYMDSSTRFARVKKFINGSWMDVGPPSFLIGKVNFIDLVIDNNEVPYICYSDSSYNGNLTIRKFDGSTWIIVGNPGFAPVVQNLGFNPIIDLDGSNNVYAALIDTISGGVQNLSVYKFNGTTWTNLGIIGKPFFDFSFSVDKVNNIPYVVYADEAVNYQATAKKYNGSNWVTVGNAGFTNASIGIYYLSLKIDQNGDPVFAFQDDDKFERISTYKFSGGNWNIVGSERFSKCHSFYTTSLAIDKNNLPIVAFLADNYQNGAVTVMNFTNTGNWNIVGYRGFSTTFGTYKSALAIDTMNVPYVVFPDSDNGNKISVKKFYTSLLPLTFMSFTALVKSDESVYLNWKTASEVNTSYFNIQRSLDGNNFQNIGKLKAFSSSGNGKYEFYDHLSNQIKGVIYYRLQIIDNDGHYKYSEVKSVKVQSNSKYFIMPNPAKDFVVVSGNNIAAISIADVTGKTLMSNKNNRINISGLAKGIYFIRIEGNDGTIQTEKLLVE